jgi:thiamine biosynthesis lipoprotein
MISTYRRTIILSAVVLSHTLAACGERGPTEYKLSGPTMGTHFNVSVVTASNFEQQELQTRIHATLEDVDQHMSTYRPDSELATFNQSTTTEWVPVSAVLCAAVDDALELTVRTAGAFDITVGPLVNLWGFGPDASRDTPPSDELIDEARARTGYRHLQTDCSRPAIRKGIADLQVDLSGYAKGLAADEIAALLDENGISNYLVEVGGDLRARGHNASHAKWRIAIERPDQTGNVVEKIIHISNLSVATSGDYRNFFEFEGQRFSHTIDPQTGRPVAHNLASVTVLGERAAYADAMATALLVLGPDGGTAFAEREGIAAHFLLRDDDGLTGRSSTQFKALVEQ